MKITNPIEIQVFEISNHLFEEIRISTVLKKYRIATKIFEIEIETPINIVNII